MVRTAAVTVLVAAVLTVGAPVAGAQSPDSVSRAAADLPTTLFQAPPDDVPRPAGVELDESGAGAPVLLAAGLIALAAVAGYYSGSASRTRRS